MRHRGGDLDGGVKATNAPEHQTGLYITRYETTPYAI